MRLLDTDIPGNAAAMCSVIFYITNTSVTKARGNVRRALSPVVDNDDLEILKRLGYR